MIHYGNEALVGSLRKSDASSPHSERHRDRYHHHRRRHQSSLSRRRRLDMKMAANSTNKGGVLMLCSPQGQRIALARMQALS